MFVCESIAGSENVRKTASKSNEKGSKNANNATPKTRKKQVKEAGNILKSLTALSQVIDALLKGKKHVPYKDSKLTRLLQNSLGGNCKTALLICASPHIYNRYETIRSLKFGLRCQQIQNYISMEQEDDEPVETKRKSSKSSKRRSHKRTSMSMGKTPLTDSKSLTLKLNHGEKSVKVSTLKHEEPGAAKDEKSLEMKKENSGEMNDDEKSTPKDANKIVVTVNPDIEDLMRQIEQLNMENDLLRTRDDLSQNISNLNETISRIVLQVCVIFFMFNFLQLFVYIFLLHRMRLRKIGVKNEEKRVKMVIYQVKWRMN